jgi:hypothetical protein
MRKVSVLVLGLAAVLACPADALELKNARAAYDLLGAPKKDNKFVPGDVLTYIYEIADLKVDEKTGVAQVQQLLEILKDGKKEGKGELVYKNGPLELKVPLFGAHRMPGFGIVAMTTEQEPGKYRLRITITDKLEKDKDKATKVLTYDFELLKKQFAIVQPATPAVAFLNQNFVVNFSVAGMAPDPKSKSKLPDVEVSLRLLKAGKPTVPLAVVNNVRDLHNPPAFDIAKMPSIPMSLPIVLSRPGTFTIEIEATDRIAKQTKTLRLPLTVVDPSQYLKIEAAGE